MKKSILLCVLLFVVLGRTMAVDLTVEKPNTEDVFHVLGYTYWKFSVPNEKKQKILQCTLLVNTKDKNGVWQKQVVQLCEYKTPKDAKTLDKFTIGFYLKDNDYVLKLESQVNSFRASNKFSFTKMEHSSSSLSIDENGEIILKWSSNSVTEPNKKENMVSYLSLQINMADSLK